MNLPAKLSEAEERRAYELMGDALATLKLNESLSDADRQQLTRVLGLLNAKLHKSAFAEVVTKMQREIEILQGEMANLQRQTLANGRIC
jgi:ABC-type methionine transport system ATPase subunit